MMKEVKWTRVEEKLPEAVYGEMDWPPIVSDDVLMLFETGVMVGNYDHDAKQWVLVNHGFSAPDCDPIYWAPIPEMPEGWTRKV